MGRGLNVLPVRHEYAPGEEPSVIETGVAFFSEQWGMEQFIAFILLMILGFVVGQYLFGYWAKNRPSASDTRPQGYGSLGASFGALRRERMPRPASGGAGPKWEAPNLGAGGLSTHRSSLPKPRAVKSARPETKRRRGALLLDDTYLAQP